MKWKVAVAAFATAIVLAGCGTSPSEPEEGDTSGPQGTFHYGVASINNNWSTQEQPGEVYLGPVYEGLVRHAPDGMTIEPKLATEWTITNTEARFTLKEGVVFHDGSPFNAEAVVKTFEYVRDAGSRWSGALAGVDEMVAEDEHTFVMKLSAPKPTLLADLAARGFVVISPNAIDDESFMQHPVGTGPYALNTDDTVPGSLTVFDVFEDYHDIEAVGPERIELHFISDESAGYNAILTGQIDAYEIRQSTVERAKSEGLGTVDWTVLRYHLLMHDRAGVFADKRVRQALCHAMPLEQIKQAQYEGNGSIAHQRFNEGDPAFVKGLTGYEYDLDKAKSLLEEAGNPSISIEIPYGASFAPLHTLIGESFGKIGIDVELTQMENSQYFSILFNSQYPLIYNTSTSEDAGMASYYAMRFAEKGGGNPMKVAPPAALAAAYEAAMAEEDPDAQAPHWQEMTQIIHDEALDCAYFNVPQTIAYDTDRVDVMAVTTNYPSAVRYLDIRMKN